MKLKKKLPMCEAIVFFFLLCSKVALNCDVLVILYLWIKVGDKHSKGRDCV